MSLLYLKTTIWFAFSVSQCLFHIIRRSYGLFSSLIYQIKGIQPHSCRNNGLRGSFLVQAITVVCQSSSDCWSLSVWRWPFGNNGRSHTWSWSSIRINRRWSMIGFDKGSLFKDWQVYSGVWSFLLRRMSSRVSSLSFCPILKYLDWLGRKGWYLQKQLVSTDQRSLGYSIAPCRLSTTGLYDSALGVLGFNVSTVKPIFEAFNGPSLVGGFEGETTRCIHVSLRPVLGQARIM